MDGYEFYMFRYITNAFSIIRGIVFCHIMKYLFRGKVCVGGRLLKYRDVSINSGISSSLQIGRGVRLNEHSTVSVLKGGELVIGDGVGIGSANFIVCHSKISIGENTIFGPNVLVYDHDHIYDSKNGVDKKCFTTAPVTIGKNCWIGANVVILKGTTIGDNCVVGAGTVIKGIIPSGTLIKQNREYICKKI